MGLTTKYEKIDSNNIKRYLIDDVLNKQTLQDLNTDYTQIRNLPDSRIQILIDEFKLFSTIQDFKDHFQSKIDEIDYLLDLYNNTTTPTTVDFIDE